MTDKADSREGNAPLIQNPKPRRNKDVGVTERRMSFNMENVDDGVKTDLVLPITFMPFGLRHLWIKGRCCFSCISLRRGCFFIGATELLVLAIMELQMASMAASDGHVFYTTYFEGCGVQFLAYSIAFTFLSTLIIGLLFYGLWKAEWKYVIPHIFWQTLVLVMLGTMWGFVYTQLEYERIDILTDEISLQSGIVILVFIGILLGFDAWFLSAVIRYCHCVISDRQKARDCDKDGFGGNAEITVQLTSI